MLSRFSLRFNPICSTILNVGAWFRASEGFAKRGPAIPAVARESVVVCDIFNLYLQVRQHIHLFFLFGKNEGEDISEQERRALRRMADAVLKEGERHA
jgi:hypothetical protein